MKIGKVQENTVGIILPVSHSISMHQFCSRQLINLLIKLDELLKLMIRMKVTSIMVDSHWFVYYNFH